ncbi:hypothetical protein F3Y22_tig00110402pilonHSYRG00117 [Hibiscus syriacus]|uniref:SOSEKI DIX-like domain-containing protein n=1 Tax=Hibiscus syriacus TaxID=106335 RepID=A0A6A3AQ32_HIBSY|nr:hypothetical protein F3Y22_tig00110402pilonHSYRG00117 [Hibiscus syriacus]
MNGRSRRRARESSPDRAKVCMQQQQTKAVKPIRKVQVVYYLTRNGQLEHPHYMEVTHLVNQPLRLRDVMERLTALRGKGMPSLYSWSCKRTYKNGYVWNDLADNDVIPPSDGAEYVLKGSELVDGCSERLQQIQISKMDPKLKPSAFALTRQREPQASTYEEEQEFDDDEEEEYELDEEKTCYTSSTTTPHSRCSRGVSTDELEYQETNTQKPIIEKQDQTKNTASKRFEDGDSVANGRNSSVLLQLIALKVNEDDQMISCMSENPRFGNLQAEEKEYFSGSIVESIKSENRVVGDEPSLKRSNSYDEERSCKAALSGTLGEEKKDKVVKGNCIPRKKLPKQTRKS